MNLDFVPIWLVFAGTVLVVMLFMEVGYRLGKIVHRRSVAEKETQIPGVSSAVLGLAAFILAFSFSLATERYDARTALVRDDAAAIGTAFLRAHFLPGVERTESRDLIKQYVGARLTVTRGDEIEEEEFDSFLAESERIQRRLWGVAVENAERDVSSNLAALYVASLNQMMDVHASRLAVGVRMRIPPGVWVVLYSLIALGMASIGYHAAIADSKRSGATLILAISFALVVSLIAALDRPWGVAAVDQHPLADLSKFMSAE